MTATARQAASATAASPSAGGPARPGPVVLYDGVCGLCNRTVRFVLARDRRRLFRFAALQSDYARAVLTRHGRDPNLLDAVCVVLEPGTAAERVISKSCAAILIGRRLGEGWALVANLLRLVPRPVRDLGYDGVARVRYRLFGRYESCPIPSPAMRERFVELA